MMRLPYTGSVNGNYRRTVHRAKPAPAPAIPYSSSSNVCTGARASGTKQRQPCSAASTKHIASGGWLVPQNDRCCRRQLARHQAFSHGDQPTQDQKQSYTVLAQGQKERLTEALQAGLRVVIDASYVTGSPAWAAGQGRPQQTGGQHPLDMHQPHEGQQQQPQQDQQACHQPPGWQLSHSHETALDVAQQVPATKQRQLVTGSHIGKETRSLAKQIELAAAFNKRCPEPVALTVTSFTGPLQAFANFMGAATWPINKHAEHLLELYGPGDIVLLSPDAAAPLLALDASKVYVIGGIVDKTVQKGLTLGFAQQHGLAVARLPIREHAQQLGLDFPGASTRPVLSVTDVVKALIEFNRTHDWVLALLSALPRRRLRQHGTQAATDDALQD